MRGKLTGALLAVLVCSNLAAAQKFYPDDPLTAEHVLADLKITKSMPPG